MSDKEHIQKISSSNRTALEVVIPKYYNDIYTYCYRRLGNRYDAQDMTQDVFLQFCKNINTYIRRGKLRNYLFVIAHNLCVNAVKKKIPITVDDVENINIIDDEPSVNKMEQRYSIQIALDKLREEQKEVIILKYYHNFKLKEIAQIMNASLQNTQYRLYHGLKILENLLSKEDLL